MDSSVAGHADAAETSALVQAGALVLARVGVALVDVHLTAGPCESAGAVAAERAGRVDAEALVLAGETLGALVHVLGAVDSLEAVGTGAEVGAVNGARVADGARVARVAGARVVQVTEQARLARRALAVEGAHPVVARGAVEASGHGAVVDVLRAVGACPAVDADARVAAHSVSARSAVLAHAGPQRALVHVLGAVGPRVRGRAVARVRVDAIQAGGAVLAQVSRAVVHIRFAVGAREARRAGALVVERVDRPTRSAIHARAGIARDVLRLAPLARVAGFTDAAERSLGVEARSVHAGPCLALVHVDRARGSAEPRRACTRVRVLLGLTAAVI